MLEDLQPHLRAFCHLNPERSFLYDSGISSLLCHRCSGIYSGFLMVSLMLIPWRWNGLWKGHSTKISFITSIVLIGLSVIQLGIEELWGINHVTGGNARFLVGCFTALGLFQFNRMIHPNLSQGKTLPIWAPAVFLVFFICHLWLSSQSFSYAGWSALLGALTVYAIMNYCVLRSFLEKAKMPLLILGTSVMVGLEWAFIYTYNQPK